MVQIVNDNKKTVLIFLSGSLQVTVVANGLFVKTKLHKVVVGGGAVYFSFCIFVLHTFKYFKYWIFFRSVN